ncbi:hypothetical protein A0H81_08845 [Grifola frondosa]|uniref:Ankyrin repeat domain-containing protein n=1 Tax=Grifola frondosa TaxID=5627 RepID=A0A1C7M4G1_GRIFR|nr:hypothetical protein A0H81_08845 [Grifola frondosa]
MGALKYLFWRRMSPDVEDIPGPGYTALDHCTMALVRADLARVLLEHGTDVNHRDRFGSVPVVGAFQRDRRARCAYGIWRGPQHRGRGRRQARPILPLLWASGYRRHHAVESQACGGKRAGESAPGKARHWTGRSDCSAGRRMVPSSRAPNALPCAPSPRSANMRRTIVSVGAN